MGATIPQNVRAALKTPMDTPSPRPVQLFGFLWIGSAQDAGNPQFLRDKQITHVLNCAGSSCTNPAVIRDAGVTYMQLNALDVLGYPILHRHLDSASIILNEARDTGGNILVHCMMGMNRSVAIALGYLLQRGLGGARPLPDMIAQVASHRRCLTNPSFVKQLVVLDAALQAKRLRKQQRQR
jgi:hypothetical protein